MTKCHQIAKFPQNTSVSLDPCYALPPNRHPLALLPLILYITNKLQPTASLITAISTVAIFLTSFSVLTTVTMTPPVC